MAKDKFMEKAYEARRKELERKTKPEKKGAKKQDDKK